MVSHYCSERHAGPSPVGRSVNVVLGMGRNVDVWFRPSTPRFVEATPV